MDGRCPGAVQARRNVREIAEALDYRCKECDKPTHSGKNNRGLSPFDGVAAVRGSPHGTFRQPVEDASYWVPKGHRLTTRLVDEETGEVLR